MGSPIFPGCTIQMFVPQAARLLESGQCLLESGQCLLESGQCLLESGQ